MNKRLVKFDHVLQVKKNFDSLLNEIGIPHSGNNRFDKYESILKIALSTSKPKDTVYLRHAISELSDLEAILILYKAKIFDEEKLLKLLPIIISGEPNKESRKNAKPDPSRNKMFEVLLLNHLFVSGLLVKYEEGNDIRFVHKAGVIAIECKRLKSISETSIKTNLRKAYHQLDAVKKECFCGMVAIGIEEDIFSKDQLLLVDSAETAENTLNEFNKNFINKYGKFWQLPHLIKDKNFSPAILICVRAAVYDFRNNITGTGFFITVNNTMYPTNKAFDLIKDIKFIDKENSFWA